MSKLAAIADQILPATVLLSAVTLGIGIITGVTRARRPDTPPSSTVPVERERVIERR